MRCSSIKIHAEIPVPHNSDGKDPWIAEPSFQDENGNVYHLEAIRCACEEPFGGHLSGIPIIRYDDNGSPVVIGKADCVKWNPNGYIEVDGVLDFGGTSEDVLFDSSKDIVSMDIESIGIGT